MNRNSERIPRCLQLGGLQSTATASGIQRPLGGRVARRNQRMQDMNQNPPDAPAKEATRTRQPASINGFRNSLVTRLIFSLGIIIFISIAVWAFFNINYQKRKVMKDVMEGTQRLSNTIRLGTHYAMMLNSRDDINQIISNIGRLSEIQSIRIYNKNGRIKYSNTPQEVERVTNIKSEACVICHRSEPPVSQLPVDERVRIFTLPEGHRAMGLISPIYNETGCSTGECHAHPEGKKVLGALDVVLSLENADAEILLVEKGIIGLAVILFLFNSSFVMFFVVRFVKRPISKIIRVTRRITRGDYSTLVEIQQKDEMGELAQAMNRMVQEIGKKQEELNDQRNRYQGLFEGVPCIITVQDRNYRLVGYNREFSDRFAPAPGDFCYRAYKGRESKCIICPVEKTFEDGRSHTSEEVGINKDGTKTYWVVRTAPIRNESGEIVAAMEMNLDITEQKRLEEKLAVSERKYHAIFDNIPNPVFVVDMETLSILNCNESVKTVYGFEKKELLDKPFMDLFVDSQREEYASRIRSVESMTQVRNRGKAGKALFVNIRIALSEYDGKQVFLVTTSDITQRLEAEQQLIHASKMATLGEMATGVAHELNQPLAVIKTASSFFMKKIKKQEPIRTEVLLTMAEEIDRHVDRATKIISHMREFGRKSENSFTPVDVNAILKRAFEIFSQQLKVRGIEVEWETQETLPPVKGDPDRLEQVFINLLINARDAIEDKWNQREYRPGDKKIILRTLEDADRVTVEIEDTGPGIPKAIAEKIFEPFFTTKEVGKGTGLGLSISYGIVKDCGGDIRLASEPGKGAKFIIQCPVAGKT